MLEINARYIKLDKFKSPVFNVNKKDKDYEMLKELSMKLESKYSRNPIYYNEEYGYINIRFKRTTKFNFVYLNEYAISCDLYETETDDKKYINLIIDKVELVKKHVPKKGSKVEVTDL